MNNAKTPLKKSVGLLFATFYMISAMYLSYSIFYFLENFIGFFSLYVTSFFFVAITTLIRDFYNELQQGQVSLLYFIKYTTMGTMLFFAMAGPIT